MIAVLLAFALGGAVAEDGWEDTGAGKRHVKSGLVCPVTAGSFELKSATGDDASFNCRYTLRCRSEEGCTEAIGFASVTWDPKMDFATQFKGLAASQKLAISSEEGPAWAGPPKLWATGGEGANSAHAGWWLIQSQGRPLNMGVMFNAAAEESANALVGATALANP